MKKEQIFFDINRIIQESTEPKHTLTEQIKKELIDRFITKENVIKYLKGNKPKQIIGFTIGNLELNNIIYENDEFKGLINISEAGLCDIYYDLVSCEKSIEENLGNEYVSKFYDSLGIEKDSFKSDYYKIIIELLK